MTSPVRVTDPGDPRVADFTGLTDVAARTAREPAEGLFIAEGAKVIRRALAAGYQPRVVLTEPKWYAELAPALPAQDVEVLVAAPEVLRSVTGYHVHRGALASFHRRALPEVATLVRTASFVVVLVDLVDHTNVGALFRTAAALGADAVVVSRGCADPLYRRSIKVSMGAVLTLPWARAGADPLSGLQRLQTIALTPDAGARDIDDLAGTLGDGSARALVLGTEGPGLPRAVLDRVDARARIPMAHGIDSLNVAAAAAVAMHVLRPRGTGPRGTSPRDGRSGAAGGQ